ncbi:unnamed protein product [Durusdinium trenchii]|uniref:Anaphase-promoting complex subunit 11 n=1 Tax=Durusdinium trenchii TaxID=1381693 RepID=A0ABP0N516_9DINO
MMSNPDPHPPSASKRTPNSRILHCHSTKHVSGTSFTDSTQTQALVLCSYRLLYSKVYRHRLQQLAGLALAVETTDQATTETGPVDLRSLRRNTRRFREDVRSLLWGEEINDPSQLSFPVLEQLWWRRIVLDEFHELEAMGNTAQFESLRSIHAHYRWGLTGTPPTRDLSQVATLAQIFHLGHLPLEEKPPSAYRTDLAQEMCQHFLDHFARQNTSEEVTPVPLKEHILVVDPTPEERAIYLQCSRDVSDASGALTDEDRAERLIKLCSHFAAYCGLATAAADATGECHRIISTKQEHAKKTYNVALQRAVQLELLWQRLDAAQYRHSDQQDVCRSLGVDSAELGAAGAEGDAKVAEVGTWTLSRSFSSPVVSLAATVLLEASRMPPGQLQRLSGKPLEISDLASAREAAKGRMVSAAQTALSAQRSVEFFKRTLAAARGEASAEQRSCSICLEEDLTEDQLSITVCAHVFHTDCLNEVVKHFGTCPVCRHGLTGKNKVTSLAAELAPALPAVRSDKGQKRRLSSDTSETSKKAGSKLAALAVHLQSISAGEKVLVFCQWEDLKKHISDTLQSMGVPHFQLIGNLFQRAEILRRFQEESHESAVRVLLLSLEHAASGTNLTAANHVVFVHPMHAASPEKAVAYEAQAIARCRRYGQEKTVHCWRLVARGTIEETITATHQKDLWQDHVARSAPTSGGA